MHGFLLAHCYLICKPECVRKTATPAARCNSRFAGGFPRLAGIFIGKTRKNSLNTPTSRSHNFSVRTLIHANLISLESRLHELSIGMLHNPFGAPKGQKTVQTQKIEKDPLEVPHGRYYCHVAHMSRTLMMCDASSGCVSSSI